MSANPRPSDPKSTLRPVAGGICSRLECLDHPANRSRIAPALERLDAITLRLTQGQRWTTKTE